MKRTRMRRSENRTGWVFAFPFALGFLLFMAYPLTVSLRMSFSRLLSATGLSGAVFIGIENYLRAFTSDITFMPIFLKTVKDTAMNTPLTIIFSLMLAIFINKNIALKGFFRVVFFLPFLLGTGYVMQQLLGVGSVGSQITVARSIFIPEDLSRLLGPVTTAFVSDFLNRITLVLWKSGVQILLFLSALQSISPSLYESAKCDAATEWEMFWKITLPMISPTMLLVIVYSIVDSFSDIQNGIIGYFNELAFKTFQFDYASAVGWIYFAFLMLLLGLVFAVMRRITYYAGE